jgi:hypothetical protein
MRNRAAPTIAILFAASTLWAANACSNFSGVDAPVAEGAADGPAADGPAADGPSDSSIAPDVDASEGPGRIYLMGGESPDTAVDAGYGFTNRVFYATQKPDGALGGWTETKPMQSFVHGNAAVASSGAIVTLAGEVTSPFGVSAFPAASRAPILADGTLDDWSDTAPLTESIYFHAAVAVDGRVYVIGGSGLGVGPIATVRLATLAAEGTIGLWAETMPLPVTRTRLAAATDGTHIFVVGGLTALDGGASACVPEVLVGTIGANGEIGDWTPTGQTVSTQAPAAAVFANKLYVLGGFDCGGTTSKKVRIADIQPDGKLGAFITATDLPSQRSALGAVVLGHHLYAVGGNDGDTRVPDVFFADLDPTTGNYDVWHPGAALPIGVSFFGIAAH